MRRWTRRLGLGAIALGLGLLVVVGVAEPAFAHQCSSPFMCFCTAASGIDSQMGLLVLEALSLGLSMIPFVGWLKGVVEAGTGEDLVTGRKLSDAERYAGAIPWGKLAIGAGALAGLAGAGFAVSRRVGRGGRALDEDALIRRVNQGLPPSRTVEERFPGLGRIRSTGGNDCSRCSLESLDAIRGRPPRPVPPESYRGMSPGEIQQHMGRQLSDADRADFYWRSVGQDMSGFDAIRGRQQIVDGLLGRPDGSQALVRVMYDNGTAHVLNAVNDGGRVVFLDRQAPGGTWSGADWSRVTDATVLHVPESYFR